MNRPFRPGIVLPTVAALAALATIGLAPPARTVMLAVIGAAIVAGGELAHRIHVLRGWRGQAEAEPGAEVEPVITSQPPSRRMPALTGAQVIELATALCYGAAAGAAGYALVVVTTAIAPGGSLFVLVGGAAAVIATALLAGASGRSSTS